jgi:hypothetical protein
VQLLESLRSGGFLDYRYLFHYLSDEALCSSPSVKYALSHIFMLFLVIITNLIILFFQNCIVVDIFSREQRLGRVCRIETSTIQHI